MRKALHSKELDFVFVSATHIKWNTIKLITYYFLKKVKNDLNLVLENLLELIVYLISTMKINQLDLKHLCYDLIYVIMWMRIF